MVALVQRSDRSGAAVLTLDSPANRNALSRDLVLQLQELLAGVEDDPSARAVVLTATGGTFCAGADLAAPPMASGPGSFVEVLRTLWDFPKPVVVAVNGHVRAGGLGLVACGDIVYSVASASYAFTEVRIGVAPAVISVLALRRMAPWAASRYLLTGERFGADDALRAGLVTEVVPDGELAPAVDRLSSELGQCEPRALAITRGLLRRVPTMDVDAGLAYTQEISQELFASEAAAEGIAAFKARRPPRWAAGSPGHPGSVGGR